MGRAATGSSQPRFRRETPCDGHKSKKREGGERVEAFEKANVAEAFETSEAFGGERQADARRFAHYLDERTPYWAKDFGRGALSGAPATAATGVGENWRRPRPRI
jgi:hypothetical protein